MPTNQYTAGKTSAARPRETALVPCATRLSRSTRISGDPVHGKAVGLHAKHTLDPDCVKWHAATFAAVGK
jgi:hypothetical protein